jgi:predicted Zn-dependent peptidase
VAAVVKSGAVNDAKQAGLAHLTNDAIRLGSAQFNKQKVDQTFDFKGAVLDNFSGLEQGVLYADFARDDAASLLPIFADIVQKPAFDAAEFDKLRARKVAELKRAKESPRNVTTAYYNGMLYGTKPYGNPSNGTELSVAALNVADVQQFHQRYYRPDNAALVVVGDFKASAMREQISALFGGWQGKGDKLPAAAGLGQVQADAARVWLVNKADARETTFLIGGKGIARNDPDYVPLQVLNTILGGRFTSWLNDELRVNSGLTYGARSSFNTLSQTGSFAISSFTATETTAPALELALKTYNRLWDKGVDAATLESAKAYVKGQYPPRFETNQQLALLMGDMFVSQVGREQIDNFTKDVDSVTPAKAKQLIDKHFPRKNLQMLLIGKAEAIRPIAAKYGTVTEIDITADGFLPK